ncbi:MAG: hypothetical protein ACLR8L_00385 [Oscillospiraceae bacterium]
MLTMRSALRDVDSCRFKFGGCRRMYAAPSTARGWRVTIGDKLAGPLRPSLTWAPVSRDERQQQRGYDQAELLCQRSIAYAGSTPMARSA